METKTTYVEPDAYMPKEIVDKIFKPTEEEEKEKANQDIRDYVNNNK